jgi:LysR family transcriptional regulator, glycine cleavage system transcriptional activator
LPLAFKVKNLAKTNRDSCGNASTKVSRGNHRQLPPLNAVRAFEAAARTGGFQAAGVELNVSANAVGRLVKVLEDRLGVELFKRLARGVAVTEAGRSYLESIETLFDQLADATADLQRQSKANRLTISAGPSFVARWLVPRLGRLAERFPGLDVRLQTSVLSVDFAREDVDVAIRHALKVEDGLHGELLLHEDFFPVCSPELLAHGNLRQLSDLAHHVLLHYERPAVHPDQMDWPRWLACVGEGSVDVGRSLQFTFAHLALQAAAAGQGVALASSALIGDDVATGRLVKPFGDISVSGPYRYFVVSPRTLSGRQKVAAFRAWALEEAATDGCAAPAVPRPTP